MDNTLRLSSKSRFNFSCLKHSDETQDTAGSLRTWDCLTYSTDTSDYLPDATNMGRQLLSLTSQTWDCLTYSTDTSDYLPDATNMGRQLLSLTSQTWDCLTYRSDTSASLPDVTNMGLSDVQHRHVSFCS